MIDEVVSVILEAVGEGVFGLANKYRRITVYIISFFLIAAGVWLLWHYRGQLFELPVPTITGAVLIAAGLGLAGVTAIAGSAARAREPDDPNRIDRHAV
jgi:RsiW-degrading membrane proteinase PrsW (M82 family)